MRLSNVVVFVRRTNVAVTSTCAILLLPVSSFAGPADLPGLIGELSSRPEGAYRQGGKEAVEHITARLAQLPGVVAVALGGSRARGEARPDSDWDFGLYYRGWIDPADVRGLGWPGDVTVPGGGTRGQRLVRVEPLSHRR